MRQASSEVAAVPPAGELPTEVAPGTTGDRRYPPFQAQAAPPHADLPAELSSFVGREREVAEAGRLLTEARLLNLTGPGGVGKTRLALRVAAGAAGAFPGGVRFVSLAPVRDPGLVPAAVAVALGIRDEGAGLLLAALRRRVRHCALLLVLDNCEHLMGGVALLVADLLAAAPRLRVLATSRAPLRVRGEQEYPVPALNVASGEHSSGFAVLAAAEATRLFVERARAVRPDFTLTDADAVAVAGICRRLDGLPLAIELAASRLRHLSPAALDAQLGAGRLPLLTDGARDAPARHRTLRDALAWSHSLLKLDRRLLFGRLSVFVGGCALEDAEAVCGGHDAPVLGVIDGLASLVDQSLLRRQEQEGSVGPRFAMLDTVREFAAERLHAVGEAQLWHWRHALHFAGASEEHGRRLRGAQQETSLAWFEAEHDNLRAALRWTITERQGDIAARLGAALWWFWYLRGHLAEGRCWLADTVAVADDAPAHARAAVLHGAAMLAFRQGDWAAAGTHGEASAAAAAGSGHALAVRRSVGDPWLVANTLDDLADLALSASDWSGAATLAREGLLLYRDLGDADGAAAGISRLADLDARSRRPARAARLRAAAASLRAGWERHCQVPHRALGLEQAVEEALALAAPARSEPMAVGSPSRNSPLRAAAKWPPDQLTPREHEVVTLIARGCSNREIAATLVITEGTAIRHVSNILGKLGLRSRAGVAAWMTRAGPAAPSGSENGAT